MSNRKVQSTREQASQQQSTKGPSGFYIHQGVRNFILFVLGWSAISHLSMITGIWDYEGIESSFDVVMSTLNVIIPVIGCLFIGILYDTE